MHRLQDRVDALASQLSGVSGVRSVDVQLHSLISGLEGRLATLQRRLDAPELSGAQ